MKDVTITVDTTLLNSAKEYDLTVDLEFLAQFMSLKVFPVYAQDGEWEPNMPLGSIVLKGALEDADYAALNDILSEYEVEVIEK